LRLAKLALSSGDSALARSALSRQLAVWERGDPDLPDLREARGLSA